MVWQSTPYTFPLLVAGLLGAAVAWLAWRRRPAPGATALAAMMLGVTIWACAYGLEWATPDLGWAIAWHSLMFVGIVIVPGSWLVFILAYMGYERYLTQRNVGWLFVQPLMTLLLAWTNPVHHLFWVTQRMVDAGSVSILDTLHGPAFWLHAVYSYLLLAVAAWVIVRTLRRSAHLYRSQAGALLIAAVAPWLGNFNYISGLHLLTDLDLTPFAFLVTGLAMSWALFRLRLLDLVPVARDALIEAMGDGMIVLDDQERIADLNAAAERIIDRRAADILGTPAAQVFADRADLVERYRGKLEGREDIVVRQQDGAQRYFDLRITPLYGAHRRLTGRLIALRDVTERKRAEEDLRQAHDELEQRVQERTAELAEANRTLQASVDEKEVLLKEIHHRVKNNLQVMSSLLYLQMQDVDDPALRARLVDSQNRIRSMALVHEKLYRSRDLARIDFAEYVASLANTLFRSYLIDGGAIRLSLHLEPVLLGIDTATSCGLLLNELVSNALKYAFPGGRQGEIAVSLRCVEAGRVALEVSDDGVGLPDDFTVQGSASLGLQLVDTLVRQVDGRLELDRRAGARFTIVFPDGAARAARP